jgi:hypothetical protein
MKWDVFISHASEDKELVARPLANLLSSSGLSVWLDENELGLGDSLRAKIDQGLAGSRFGVVVLSPAFFAKDWPQRELDGLAALESPEHMVILPIWHGVDQREVAKHSPLLAGKLAGNTDRGLGLVAVQILRVVIPLRAKELGLPLDRFFPEDRSMFDNITEVFNRPAFRGPFLWQTDPDPFQRAIKVTIKALNTGEIDDSSGATRKKIEPISKIRDAKLHATMQEVETQLKATYNLIDILKSVGPDFKRRSDIIREIDIRRDGIIGTLNSIWQCFGLHPLPIPTQITTSTDVWESFSS